MLADRKVRSARSLATAAAKAAERQYTTAPGVKTVAKLVHSLAEDVMDLNKRMRGE